MILGAVIDAGIPIERLREELGKLNVVGFELSCQPAQRGGLRGTLVTVEMDESGRKRRNWRDFIEMAQASTLPPVVVERVCAVFKRLAEAEAAVHGESPEDVHLHELGELDTLIDVVGGVVGLELLGIERLYASPFPLGSGVVRSDHGVLPVPSPATAALFAMAQAPVVSAPGNATETGEMVTPTGAAILTTLATFRQPSLNVERVGYGLGSRESRHYPNALVLWVGEDTGAAYSTSTRLIETNLDDMPGELLGYVQERLLALGARDVWFTPIQMKKNRPATMLSIIVPVDLEQEAVRMVMRETTTLGVRVRPLARYEAEREAVRVDTSLGPVSAKLKRLEGKVVDVSAEYDDCRSIALEGGMALRDVVRIVQRELEDRLLES